MAIRTSLVILSIIQVYSWDYFQGGKDWTGKCATGKNQSPINLKNEILTYIDKTSDIASIEFDLEGTFTSSFTLSEEGNFVITKKISEIIFNSAKVSVKNIHYHSPSEHSIEGDLQDLELHFFSADTSGQGYGFAVFFNVGENENKFVQASIDSYVKETDQYFDTTWLVENGKLDNFYLYDGSITNPHSGDCSEIIIWTVISEPLEISQDQLDFFDDLWKNNDTFAGGRGSNRVIQKLNGRTVYYYSDSDSESSAGYLAIGLVGLFIIN